MKKYKKYLIGQTFVNNKGLSFEIIDYCNDSNKRKIRFIETGYECEVYTNRIDTGNIKDYMFPSVAGVGILCEPNLTKHPLYNRWSGMICRCYEVSDIDYKTYGAKGVTVCKEWHKFTNYINDIQNKENYDKLLLDGMNWHIDKDTLVPGNKIYSNETTCIIQAKDNVIERNKRNPQSLKGSSRCVVQYSLDGQYINEYPSATEAQRQTGINASSILSCCKEKYNHSGGYKWKYK